MDFELTEKQKRIQETAAEFVKSELEPIAAELDRTKNREKLLAVLKKLAGLGFMGITIDPKYGGTGAETVSFSLVMTEIGRACASTGVTSSVTNMVAEVIQGMGTEQLREKYIPPLCSGEFAAGGFALTETVAGSDPAAMRMSAVLDGDYWVLDGQKIFISSAEFAGVFVVWAVTDKEARKGRGISAFLVEPSFPGFRVGQVEKKLGQLASPTNEVIFDKCRVPKENLLGVQNDGFRIAASELAGGRIGIGSMAMGVGIAAMDFAAKYAKEVQGKRTIGRQPGYSIDDSGELHEACRCETPAAARGVPQGPEEVLRQGSFDGQGLRYRIGEQGLPRRLANRWRIWLHPGLSDGTFLPGCTRHLNL